MIFGWDVEWERHERWHFAVGVSWRVSIREIYLGLGTLYFSKHPDQ